jgi:hypothetical protein
LQPKQLQLPIQDARKKNTPQQEHGSHLETGDPGGEDENKINQQFVSTKYLTIDQTNNVLMWRRIVPKYTLKKC